MSVFYGLTSESHTMQPVADPAASRCASLLGQGRNDFSIVGAGL